MQSQIRRQQEEALAREEEKEAEEEVEEESRVVEPLMRLVEAIFSLPTVRPRSHQQGRHGRKNSVEKVKKNERGESEAKLPTSGEKQRGGEEARVEVKSVDGQNGGAEKKRIPGNSKWIVILILILILIMILILVLVLVLILILILILIIQIVICTSRG